MSRFVPLSTVLAVGSPLLPMSRSGLARWVSRTIRHLNDADKRRRPRSGRGGGHEYDIGLFPLDVRAALARCWDLPPPTDTRPDLWAAFETSPPASQDEARRRLDAVGRALDLSYSTLKQVAVGVIARDVGVSTSTLWRWIALTDGVAQGDWLAALAPRRRRR